MGPPRPLGNLNAAMRDLDLKEEEILVLLSHQRLIGFNIALKTCGMMELRVLTRSLEHFRETGGQSHLKLDWPHIFRRIFPAAAGPLPPYLLTGVELQQALNCSRGHVKNLAARYFEILRPGRKGRGHTAGYRASSVERWLQSRMF
jgi:hypothetical protein